MKPVFSILAGLLAICIVNTESFASSKNHYEVDAQAVSITSPANGGTVPQKVSFRVSGSFREADSATDIFDVPVRVEIRRCSDGRMFFKADTTMPALYGDAVPISITFPSKQGIYDSRALLPDCYRIAIIARYPTDGDHTNDTAYSDLTVLPHSLSDDITADSIFAPLSYPTSYTYDQQIPVKVRFKNTGLNDESLVKLAAVIVDQNNKVVYRDSLSATYWQSGTTRLATFANFAAAPGGGYNLYVMSLLPNDQFKLDDTLTRNFNVVTTADVVGVSIVEPLAGSSKAYLQPYRPSASFRLIGNVDTVKGVFAQLTIQRCSDGVVVAGTDTIIPYLSLKQGLTTIIFPPGFDNYRVSDISPGCYVARAFATIYGDADHSNDTAVSQFTVVTAHDMVADTVLSPGNKTNATGSVPIAVRFVNAGINIENSVALSVEAFDVNGKNVFSDHKTANGWNAREVRIITFSNFAPASRGLYRIVAMNSIDSDQFRINDTISAVFYYGTPVIDVRAAKIGYPPSASNLQVGAPLSVVGDFEWAGGYTPLYSIPVQTIIERCSDSAIQFIADTTLGGLNPDDLLASMTPDEDEGTVTFPSEQGAFNSARLSEGCYRLLLIANLSNDGDRSNDTLQSTFTIGAMGVGHRTAISTNHLITLGPNRPNPFSTSTLIRYTLAEPARVELRVIDILGREVAVLAPTLPQAKGEHDLRLELSHAP